MDTSLIWASSISVFMIQTGHYICTWNDVWICTIKQAKEFRSLENKVISPQNIKKIYHQDQDY